MFERWHSLQYRPLRRKDIRLIRFRDDLSTSADISCALEHVSLDAEPVYFALPYVWGDTKKMKRITINNNRFRITRNLYDALLQLKEHVSRLKREIRRESRTSQPRLYLWVDAICINQKDVAERSAQVPRMRDIYSQAFNVLIWLGTLEQLSLDHDSLAWFIYEAHKDAPRRSPLSRRDRQSLPGNASQGRSTVMSTTMKLLMCPWFRRLWVLQEYAVAKRQPWVLVGSAVTRMDLIHKIIHQHPRSRAWGPSDASNQILNQVTRFIEDGACAMAGVMELPKVLSSNTFWSMPLPYRLETIILHKMTVECSVPHDHVYGMLGMVDVQVFQHR
jgi:hypothetical protein